jgi:predicted ATPase
MITRVEIDGHTTFSRFALDLEPFTVIAGATGAGRSNLLDALALVGRLAGGRPPTNGTLRGAFERDEGSLDEVAAWWQDGTRSRELRFALELLLPERVVDPFGGEAALDHRRVRYELTVALSGGEPRLAHERLAAIPRRHDPLLRRRPDLRTRLPTLKAGRTAPFVETAGDHVVVSQDGSSSRRRAFAVERTRATALASVVDVAYPHAFAVRRLLSELRPVRLHDTALRTPAAFAAPRLLTPEGRYLPSTLARLETVGPGTLAGISAEVAQLAPASGGVRVDRDEAAEAFTLSFVDALGRSVPARRASAGTLRALVLAALVRDPEAPRHLILEEPERGLYAGRTLELLDLLRACTLSLGDDRQLIATTQAASLVRTMHELGLDASLMFAYREAGEDPTAPGPTRIASVAPDAVQEGLFPPGEARRRSVAYREMERLLGGGASRPTDA